MLTRRHDGEPLVKLIDLGIAKDCAQEARLNGPRMPFLGKVGYCSPRTTLRHGPKKTLTVVVISTPWASCSTSSSLGSIPIEAARLPSSQPTISSVHR